ncbi:MAG: hypothetical protein KAI43_13315 [Candidatus Aureabacteria bacterium]|nr:hypothetical protein [Candidatus Auribacterota bacterium]
MKIIFFTFLMIAIFALPVSVLPESDANSVPDDFLEIINPKFRSKLESILNKKISVNVDNTHIREIIQHISISSSLSIVIDETPFEYDLKTSVTAPTTGASEKELSKYSKDMKTSKFILTIHLNDIPLKNMLWYLCQKSDLMAFWDEDIDDNIPGPVFFTSKEMADKIIKKRIVTEERKLKFKRAFRNVKQPWMQ